MINITNNGQSAAKPLLNEEGSTTIETIIETNNNNGVEYINNDGKGWNYQNNSYIYKHIRLDTNQVFYIGVGTGKNYARAKEKFNRNKYWKNIINKTDYEVQIIIDNLSQENAYELEELIVSIYGLKRKGGILCNMTEGGRGGQKGYSQSKESQIKRSNSLKGTVFTKERKENISNSLKNKIKSEEHCKNISKSLINRKLSESHIKNMIKSRYKKVLQLKNNKIIKIWDSVKEASEYYNINPSSISHCCAGRKKSIVGHNWKYLDNYDIV